MSDAERAYRLAVAIMGGEDAPGYADSVETAVLEKMARDAAEEGHRFWASALAAHGARIEALEAENARLRDRLQAIIDWSDLAQSRPAEFSSAEARMLRGPIFDRARANLEPQP